MMKKTKRNGQKRGEVKMATLWELSDELKDGESMFDDAVTEEEEDEIAKRLGEIELEFSQKMQSYLNLLKNLDANLLVIQQELERLTKAKKKIERKMKYLKDNMMAVMKEQGKDKIKVGTNNVSIAKCGGKRALWCVEPEALPETWQKTKTIVSADNDGIREYLDNCEDAGVENEYADLFAYKPRGERLSIR